MNTVRLPVFGANGMQIGAYLEVAVEHFLTQEAGLGSNHVRMVLEGSSVEEQNRRFLGMEKSTQEPLFTTAEEIQHDWRPIEGFPSYEMNPSRMIIEKVTHKTVKQTPGRNGSRVLLSDCYKNQMKMMSVEFLFKNTFPELRKG